MLEKIYRIGVLFLLAGILILEIFNITRSPQQACIEATESAVDAVESYESKLRNNLADYDFAVYEEPENINQQMFRVQEYACLAQQDGNILLQSLLDLELSCK